MMDDHGVETVVWESLMVDDASWVTAPVRKDALMQDMYEPLKSRWVV